MKIELAQRASHLLPKHRRIVKLGEVHGEAATFPSLQQTILINAHSYPRLNLRNTRVVSQDTGLSEIARSPQKSSTGGSKNPFISPKCTQWSQPRSSPETFLRQIHRCGRSPNPKGELFSAKVSDHESSNRMEKIRESKQRSERGNSVDQRDLWRNRREENGGKEEGRSEELKKKEERKKRR